MGVEATTIALGLSAATGAYGLINQNKQNKQAKNEAKAYKNEMAAQKKKNDELQSKLDRDLTRSRERAALGMARSNRARRSGGIFGDTQISANPTSQTLG